LQRVLEALPLSGSERVLDIACGTGQLERLLLAEWPGLLVIGTDVSPGMLQQAGRKRLGPRAHWLQAEACRLPFADGCCDMVVTANSFHYFRCPVQALQEMGRVLQPGGRLVFLDWCDDYLACKLCSWWLRRTDPAFFRTYSFGQCQTLLERAGFEVLQSDRFRVGWWWGLMRILCRRP
jgi:ubiquinone/menaquinone biosynthesis C-methylase UbiE